MKAIELIRAAMNDNLFFSCSSVKATVVCGSLEPSKWYYKQSTPAYGKADCVILGSNEQPIYLYLIEE
jgi:hypothetical protein